MNNPMPFPFPRDIRWVHLSQGECVLAQDVRFDWGDGGIAIINGEPFEVIWSYDGDGYTQMTDGEVDRFEALWGEERAK